MYFPSKKDMWIRILLWSVVLIGILIPLVQGYFMAVGMVIILVAFLFWFWFKTGYTIKGEELHIRYGPVKQLILIQDITNIVQSKMPLSSPALSMDRIQINCKNQYDQVTISPVDKEKFIQLLLEINPEIRTDKRLNIHRK